MTTQKAPKWLDLIRNLFPTGAYQKLPRAVHMKLADRIVYKGDGTKEIRPQWSGKAYPVTRYNRDFVLFDIGNGAVGRNWGNVKVA
jgi:hypothetical protein